MPHHWQALAVGRVCLACLRTQVDGEFNDDAPCDDEPVSREPPKENGSGPKEPPGRRSRPGVGAGG